MEHRITWPASRIGRTADSRATKDGDSSHPLRAFFVFLLCFLATAQVVLPVPGASGSILIDDFEDISDWSGLKKESLLVQAGKGSGRWENHPVSKSIRKTFSPSLDASALDYVRFWLYSGTANNAMIELIFDSENSADAAGWDYFRYPIQVNWSGWKLLRIPLGSFLVARNPVGWKKINYVQFSSDGWDHAPLPDTLLILDDMSFGAGIITEIDYQPYFCRTDFCYDFTLLLTERFGIARSLSFQVNPPAQDGVFVTFPSSTLLLPAGGREPIQVTVVIPESRILSASPLSSYAFRLSLREGDSEVDEARLLAVSPAKLPARSNPRTLLEAEDFSRMKRWRQEQPWAEKAMAAIIQSADDWPQKYNRTYFLSQWALPPEGGQWGMWYLCPNSSTYLRYEGPGRHVCPTDGKAYRGWPYDQVIYARMHDDLAGAARDLGLAYRLTGESRYAQSCAEILRAYADRYLSYALHDNNNKNSRSGGRVHSQTLDEAIWLISMAWAYDLIADSTALRQEDLVPITRSLLRAAASTLSRNPAGASNWQSWHNAALGAVGLALQDPPILQQALLDPLNGFLFQMKNSVTRDGFWYEGSWGYHFYALSAHSYLAEMSARAGLDLFAEPSLRAMFESPLSFAMPDGNLPLFNDSGPVTLLSRDTLYESAFLRYGDPAFLAPLGQRDRGREALFWGAESLPSGGKPGMSSQLFPAAGYGVLRVDSSSNPMYLALDFGPHGGGHGHYDKLGLIFFARGMVMGVDPGTQSYAAPTHETWDKQTIAHNTVVVDGKSQSAAEGTLHHFRALPGLGWMAADAGSAYSSARLLRTLWMTPEYVLDLFRIQSLDGREHDVDWVYHNSGVFSCSLPLAAYSGLPSQNGYQHLSKPAAIQTDARFLGTFDASTPPGTAIGTIYTSSTGIGATFTLQRDPVFRGQGSGRMTYDFSSATGYVLFSYAPAQTFPEAPATFRLALYGDGSGHPLTLRANDSSDERFSCSLGSIDWTGWKVVSTPPIASCSHFLGNENGIFDAPLKLVSVQVGYQSGRPPAGTLYADDLTLAYPLAGEQILADFETDIRGVRLQMLGEKGTTIVAGEGLGPDAKVPVPFLLARRRAESTAFATLLEPFGSRPADAVLEKLFVTTDPAEKQEAFLVTSATFRDRFFSATQGQSGEKHVFGSASCDGRLCFIRRSPEGGLRRLVLGDGSLLEEEGLILLQSAERLESLQADYEGTSVYLFASGSLPKSLRLWCPAARDIFLNRSRLPFQRDGSYAILAISNPHDRRRK